MRFTTIAITALAISHSTDGSSMTPHGDGGKIALDEPISKSGFQEYCARWGISVENISPYPSSDTMSPLFYAIESGSFQACKLLVEQGANMNIQTEYGWTPLIIACSKGNYEITKFLIEKGANVNIIDSDGETALLYALLWGNEEIAELLIQKGADVDSMNNLRQTPLELAILQRFSKMAELLINRNVRVNTRSDFGTPLLSAISEKLPKIAKLLIEKGADPNDGDASGATPLYYALREKGYDEVVRLLIERGANVNTPKALYFPCKRGDYQMAKYLIENGANVNPTYETGETALTLAIDSRNQELVKMLILAGATTEGIENDWVQAITNPIEAIKRAAAMSIETSRNPFEAFLEISGVIKTFGEGLIAFAFESRKMSREVNVLQQPNIHEYLMNHHGWTESRINMVESIISELVDLGCTDISVLYIIAPFIMMSDDKMIWRIASALKFLTKSFAELGSTHESKESIIRITGPVFNEMLRRASPVGFLPVVKALFTMFWREHLIQDNLERSGLPPDFVADARYHRRPLGVYEDFERNAIAGLAKAIKRHLDL